MGPGETMFRGLIALFLLAIALAADAAPLRIDDGADLYPLGTPRHPVLDRDGNLTLEQVRAVARANRFAPLPHERSNFGYVEGAMWFRFALERAGGDDTPWLLSIEYPLLDHVTLYRIDPDGEVTTRESRRPHRLRHTRSRPALSQLPVDVPAGAPSVFYLLRVQSQSSMQVPLVLARPDRYLERLLPSNLGLGLYYGVMVALLLYNLILWVSVGDRNFLWYVLYVAHWACCCSASTASPSSFCGRCSPTGATSRCRCSSRWPTCACCSSRASSSNCSANAPRADRAVRLLMLAAALPLLGSIGAALTGRWCSTRRSWRC